MTKRILAMLCALVMVFALCACGQTAEEAAPAAEAAEEAAPAEAAPAASGDNEVTFYYPIFYNTFDPANALAA